jgi:hypothetical protein
MGRKAPYLAVSSAAPRCPLRRKMLPCPCLAAVAAPGRCPCREKTGTASARKTLKNPGLAALSAANR